MQYVNVQFSQEPDLRTYHNDGKALKVGDMVKLPSRSKPFGNEIGKVVEIVTAPDFETKGVIDLVDASMLTLEGDDGLLSQGGPNQSPPLDAHRYQ